MKKYAFKKAHPVWAKGRSKEMNCELTFQAIVPKAEQCQIALATAAVYRMWINGTFVAAGPARTAHDYFKVDVILLAHYLTKQENFVVIEVVGYNVNSYDTLDQPSFLTAEITCGNNVVVSTGDEQFLVYDLQQRISKVQRYSFQRAFIDAYRLCPELTDYQSQRITTIVPETVEIQKQKHYLMRETRMPCYEVLEPECIQCSGSVILDSDKQEIIPEENYFQIGDELKGYARSETEVHISEQAQRILYTIEAGEQPVRAVKLADGFFMYCLPYNATGFYHIDIEMVTKGNVYLLFDEIMADLDINFLRMYSCNCFYYELQPGTYQLMNFAPYTMKYLKIVVFGQAVINEVHFIEYAYPLIAPNKELLFPNPELKQIYNAALRSFRANSLDVFMDCPSRERSGWLCDSYFTSEVEYILTGQNVLEKSFLENFIIPDSFAYLPEGMLPMCYPADHNNGNFIPNWAMWYVLELEKYYDRSHDRELIELAKTAVYRLISYFQKFENEVGLLENLDGWIFLEWSCANDENLVSGVNFPTNMLYMRMLVAAATLYGEHKWSEQADQLRTVIRKRSFQNGFYTDHEHREGQSYINPDICTEVCQYYAFFTGVATIAEDKQLWDTLVHDFGPIRRQLNNYPEIAFTNAFIGNYLRIELLYRNGLYDNVFENIREYFLPMAKATGTLWEHELASGSCNHGFASYVIYWLTGILKNDG